MSQELRPPLPRGWTRWVKRARLCAVGLERLALLAARAGFEHSPDPRARLTAELDAAREECALLREEARILRARMSHIAPRRKPQYPAVERLAILVLRAKRAWNASETARRFQLTAETIASWMSRLEEQGPAALVQTREPVNRFGDAVAGLVQSLHEAAPHKGRRKLAAIFARAGLALAASTVARMLQRKRCPPKAPPPPREPASPAAPPTDAQAQEKESPARVVTAKRPHHVWHVDVTTVPIGLAGSGFWVAWWPFAFVMRWLLSWHLALVLDHYSRALVAFRVLRHEPTAGEICALLDQARARAGTAPKYIISDQGVQFGADYRAWCTEHGVRPRFGAVGQHGSIALIERFILSLKSEFLRRIPVPASYGAMVAAVSAYELWYNAHRPHAALAGRTPREMLDGAVAPAERERIEPRAGWPLGRGVRRARGRLELVVGNIAGHRELPVVALREAA